MKSGRLKTVALIWLQGGHHTAPQYRSTGLLSALALAKMASMLAPSGLTQWMTAGILAVPPAAVASGVAGAKGATASGALEHATSHNGVAIPSTMARMKTVIVGCICGNPASDRVSFRHHGLLHRRQQRSRVLRARNGHFLIEDEKRHAAHAHLAGLCVRLGN